MKYTLKQCFYNDFNIIEVNKLKPRSYFIPFSNIDELNKTTLINKRYNSSKVKVLNGNWDFKFYNNPNDLKNGIDTDTISFDKIDVPSCIQYRGYSYPCYLNTRYQFKFNEPHVPTIKPISNYFSIMDGFKKPPKDEYNFVCLYRTIFNIDDLNKNYIISFLGVASCLELYLNGEFIGYSETSHNTAEFNLTNFIKKGNNELVCLVRRWCNGTYLECQDMFRNTGIFRDVLLRIDNKNDIFDIDFNYKKINDRYNLDVLLELNNEVNIDASIDLCGHNLNLSKKAKTENGKLKVTFENLDILEWSAEVPNLYDLIVSIDGSIVKTSIGFKHIEIKDSKYYFNDKLIKLLGVNHHDTSPINGYTMSLDEIKRDLDLCKEYNVNCIRTSHYAPDPFLIEYATQIGLYIVDECDIETHGVQVMHFPFNFNYLSDNKKWSNYYFDRIYRHYNRDKLLKTPVCLWSLGNESGGGRNMTRNYNYLKSVSDIPVQYESAIYHKTYAYDVVSRMYPDVSWVEKYGKKELNIKKSKDRPLYLCEYVHAMGVGPGDMETYVDLFYKYDNLMGGCVWEMNDHAVFKNGDYLYGGDNGEWIHDCNFCADGLFYPDRTPSTGAFIMKHAYRPIRIKRLSTNKYSFYNAFNFKDTKEYTISYKSLDNKEISLNLILNPNEEKIIEINDSNLEIITFTIKKNNKVIDETTFKINFKGIDEPIKTKLPKEFDIKDGRPIIKVNNDELTFEDESTLLYRAETDNDSEIFIFKPMRKWYDQKIDIISTYIDEDCAYIRSNLTVNNKKFEIIDFFTGTNDGVILTSTLIPKSKVKYIPRFSKIFKLDKSFENVSYLGRDKESYLDMVEHSTIKLNNYKKIDMTERNLKPQESGNRMDTKYLEINNSKTTFKFESIDNLFNIGIKPYTDKQLIKMKHRSDENDFGTYVSITCFMMGIGTGSCGPYVRPIYQIRGNQPYTFKTKISWK